LNIRFGSGAGGASNPVWALSRSENFLAPNRNQINTLNRVIILSFVLHGCETWSLALRKEHKLKVFENGTLRKGFVPKRDEVTGNWKKKSCVKIRLTF
jgi:hypothetical protein